MHVYFRHTLFWLTIYVLWTYMKSGSTFCITYLQVNLVNVAIYMSAYYILRHLQLPYLYDRGKIVLFALSIFIMSILFYTFWRSMGLLWMDELRGFGQRPFMMMTGYLISTVQFYSPAMALLAWESHHDRKKEQERIRELEQEKLSTELKFLKAQINPHFLFNTLNNLYSYVLIQSPKAPDMVMQLSGILDYVLYKSQQKSVALRKEVETIEHFIALEKIRYGERLQVTYKAEGDLSLPISPLILLSVVENAFKHGASGDIDRPKISILIQTENNEIKCKVWNTKSQHQAELNDAYKEGIGLSNIKRQLNLIYPNNYKIAINDEEETFDIMIVINA